jgi:NarL family two-component system response regulator LiaR
LRKTLTDVRILLVDDNEPFRRFVASALHDQPNLHVIGEVGDGFEAVRLAEALEPDLIVLDIGLQGLNGIETARRLRKLAPEAKLIFLTQESSVDVVHEALSLGAWGYVANTIGGAKRWRDSRARPRRR